jgi:lysophospholipase L1-like esterase
MKIISLHIILLLVSISAMSQSICDSLSFIKCQKNNITLSDAEQKKISNAIESGSLRIVHIGDSHLQAAFFTEKVKQRLSQYFQNDNLIASPGFIFPFTMAQTNNPFYFKVDFTGTWTRTRNVDDLLNAPVGISGITVSTKSPYSEIKIKMENQKYPYKSKYWFDRVILLHSQDNSLKIFANDNPGQKTRLGTSWDFQKSIDSVKFIISNADTAKNIDLHGFILEQKGAKVQYHTIGVNGSMAKSYLKCTLFDDHLNMLNPTIVILSLGTNEAYAKDFTKEDFIFNFTNLISKIHNTNPDAVLIVTVPNDHFKDGQPNKNVAIIRESIFNLSNYFSFGIWDFYEIMGGEGSINEWHKKQLAADDKLHFNRKGYELQGELFYQALVNIIK